MPRPVQFERGAPEGARAAELIALRRESAARLIEVGFEGYAIGGLAVGETKPMMFETVEVTSAALPADRPRYLMGVGKPADLVGAVARGVDMFDCVLPTRSGRTAQAWTRSGPLNLRNARHAEDPAPLDPDCGCPACRDHSRAYLHHLFKIGDSSAERLATLHNLRFYTRMIAALQQPAALDNPGGRQANAPDGGRGVQRGGEGGGGEEIR